MLKKIISLLMACALMISMAACGGEAEDKSQEPNTATEQPQENTQTGGQNDGAQQDSNKEEDNNNADNNNANSGQEEEKTDADGSKAKATQEPVMPGTFDENEAEQQPVQ